MELKIERISARDNEPFRHQTLVGTATEDENGDIHVRLTDTANDPFWMEFTIRVSELLKGESDVYYQE